MSRGESPSAALRGVEVVHAWIPISDGARLSAKLWLPVGASSLAPVPAILEYLPYRCVFAAICLMMSV
jgi:predicted acyl esterase